MEFRSLKGRRARRIDLPLGKGMYTKGPFLNGEMSLTQNLSSRSYPQLCTRLPRGLVQRGKEIYAMTEQEGLCYLEEDGLCYKGKTYAIDPMYRECKLLPFGRDILILPQGKAGLPAGIFRTETGTQEYLEQYEHFTGPMELHWCTEDGEIFTDLTEGSQPPENKERIWLDCREEAPCLRFWSVYEGLWSKIENAYVMLRMDGLGERFSKDATFTFDQALDPWLYKAKEEYLILNIGSDFMIFDGLLTVPRAEEDRFQLRIFTTVPLMDLHIQQGNRLWGCRYGKNRNGEFVNCIYASRLGEPGLWSSFRGLSTDSYCVSLGEPGAFTGVGVVGDCPVFFKENCLIRITGNRPANFRTQVLSCSGVRPGCEGTVANLDGRLLYLGRDGLCMYDGTEPVLWGTNLDLREISRAVAGVYGSCYYLSCPSTLGGNSILVYDTEHRVWHGESSSPVKEFCTVGGDLYFSTYDKELYSVYPHEDYLREGPFWWRAENPFLGLLQQNKGTLHKLYLEFARDTEAYIRVEQGDTPEFTHLLGDFDLSVPKNVGMILRDLEFREGHLLILAGYGELCLQTLGVGVIPEGRQ